MEISEEEWTRRKEKLEALKNNRFKQQELRAWRPVPSYGSTMIIFIIFGFFFLTLGIALYLVSDKVSTATVNYSDPAICTPGEACVVDFNIASDMPAPVYVYYELSDYY